MSTNSDGIEEEAEYYGYSDAAAHRAKLPPVYNQYALMNADNGFDRNFDDQ